MKLLSFFAVLLVFTYSFYSCTEEGENDPPVACLKLNKTELVVGDSLKVTDCSENAEYTEIYFGEEPFYSKDEVVKYAYKAAGTYKVTIMAYPRSDKNEVVTQEATVTVLDYEEGESPVPCFDYRNQLNLEVLFINCSENASVFEWDFGDEETGEGFNPTHTYAAAGTYTVSLTAYAPGSDDGVVLEQDIIVEDLGDPLSCFNVSSKTSVPNQEIQFLNCSENSFKFVWEFGDGTSSTQLNPKHSYASSGKYRTVLHAYAADGSFFDSTSVGIRVGEKYLTGFRLIKFPSTDGGDTWDPELPFPLPIDGIGPEPDIQISYKRDFDNDANETEVVYDIESSDLPYEYELDRGIKIADDVWEFAILDDEGFLGGPTTMEDWSGKLNDLGENGSIELEIGDVVLEVLYEVR